MSIFTFEDSLPEYKQGELNESLRRLMVFVKRSRYNECLDFIDLVRRIEPGQPGKFKFAGQSDGIIHRTDGEFSRITIWDSCERACFKVLTPRFREAVEAAWKEHIT